MSHIKRIFSPKSNPFALIAVTLLCTLLGMLLFANAANASEYAGRKAKKRPTYVLKTTLDGITGSKTMALDWRSNSQTISFDLPAHDWYDELDLFLNAYPEGDVSRTTPITISYNGTDSVTLHGRASQFNAQIRLDTSRLRTRGNTITISYPAPKGEACLTAAHGRWVIDLSRSKLVARARTKESNMQIRDIEGRLKHPMTSPKRVSIIARGSNKFSLEALAAQGIALRMDTVPNFKFTQGATDFQIIIGTHDDIAPYVDSRDWSPRTSAQAFVTKGNNAKLVLTAPDETQVLSLARAFSAYHLPSTSRRAVAISELYTGLAFAPRPTIEATHQSLSTIGMPILSPSWHPKPAQLDFNLNDAQTTSGTLSLKLVSSTDTAPGTKVRVMLNDKSIGYTVLDKRRKTVNFKIEQGRLRAAGNQLTIVPVIGDDAAPQTCASLGAPPSILVAGRSSLKLNNSAPSPLTNMNRFAASGAPFNTQDTTIVLTAKTAHARAASLQFLGYAAQQLGPVWSDVNYVTSITAVTSGNILVIGPNAGANANLLEGAPSALRLALKGQSVILPNTQVASLGRYAFADEAQSIQMATRQIQKNRNAKVGTGGIASVYPSPYSRGNYIGIISASSSRAFPRAMSSISSDGFWNALQGSVTRWNSKNIVMAQQAVPAPIPFLPKKSWSLPGFEMPELPTFQRPAFMRSKQNSIPLENKSLQAAIPQKNLAVVTIVAYPEPMQSTTPVPVLASVILPPAKLRGPAKAQLFGVSAPKTAATITPARKAFVMPSITKLKNLWLKFTHSKYLMIFTIALAAFFLLGFTGPRSRY